MRLYLRLAFIGSETQSISLIVGWLNVMGEKQMLFCHAPHTYLWNKNKTKHRRKIKQNEEGLYEEELISISVHQSFLVLEPLLDFE